MTLNLSPKNEQGQAAAELAIVMPVLMLILFAVIQFGIVFRDYLTLTDAVRVGARAGAVSRHADDPESKTKTAVEDAAVDLGEGLAITVSSTWEPGAELVVSAQYPYTIEIFGKPVTEGTLTTTVKERVE